MKKFYATALAIAVACSSAFALQFSKPVANNGLKGEMMTLQAAPEGVTPMRADRLNKVADLKKPSRAEVEAPEINLGSYSVYYEDRNGNAKNGSLEILAGDTDSTYIFHHYIYSDVNDLTATLRYEEEEGWAGWLLVIPGKGQVVYIEEDGQAYYLYAYGKYSDGEYYIFTNMDLEYIVEDGAIYTAYEDFGFFYGYQNADGFYGAPILNPQMIFSNTLMVSTEYEFDANDNVVEAEDPIWEVDTYTEFYDTTGDGTVDACVISNFGGFPKSIVLALDKENNSAVAAGAQLLWAAQTQAGTPVNFYLVGIENWTEATEDVNFTVSTNEEGNTVLTNNTPWGLLNLSDDGEIGDFGMYYMFDNTTITFNKNIWPEGDGVEAPVFDNNNGAAVYYNLQGQQIQNPANGLYIVKQGNKISKVLVK